jgi:serine/threonine protein phosphatase PrpC
LLTLQIRPFLNKPSDPETHFFGLYDGHAGGRCSAHLASSLAAQLVDDDLFASNLPAALKRCYHTVNDAFLKVAEKQKLHDGSTGLTCVIRDNKIVVANVGDCRALLIGASPLSMATTLPSTSSAAASSLSVHCVQLTTDHKPSLVEEQRRITQLGGCVVNCMGVPRVNRVLAVSRAFGNRTLRTVIRPDADIIQSDLANEDFLVVASDGLWDVSK